MPNSAHSDSKEADRAYELPVALGAWESHRAPEEHAARPFEGSKGLAPGHCSAHDALISHQFLPFRSLLL